MDVTKLSKKFDEFLYSFFAEECGKEEVPVAKAVKPKVFPHRGLVRMREEKKKMKKERKRLIKAGEGDSEEAKALSKKWFELVRAQSRLRAAVCKKNNARGPSSRKETVKRI